MGKLTTYTCDRCGEEYALGILEAVSVYCYPTDEPEAAIDPDISKDKYHEVKILEMEYVCPTCRSDFMALVKSWAEYD